MTLEINIQLTGLQKLSEFQTYFLTWKSSVDKIGGQRIKISCKGTLLDNTGAITSIASGFGELYNFAQRLS